MTYETSELQDSQEKEHSKKSPLLCVHECPLCKKKIQIQVDFNNLEQSYGKVEGVLPHIVLHGNPLHAMLCYVDTHLAVRGKGYVASIGISKDSSTYQQLIRLWSRSTISLIDEPLEEGQCD
jgi:hypothetical protein